MRFCDKYDQKLYVPESQNSKDVCINIFVEIGAKPGFVNALQKEFGCKYINILSLQMPCMNVSALSIES